MSGPAAGPPTRTRALVIDAPGSAQVVDVDVSPPGFGEVLVRVGAAGICGSDLELLEGRRPAPYARYPIIPGHEWAGTIAAIGPGVRDLSASDKVVAEGFRNCGRCARCRVGETNLCTAAYAETGFTHSGAFSGYVSVPARLVHRLPPDASLREAAVLEPAACVANGVLAASPRPGQTVVVIGSGTLGFLAVMMLRAYSPRDLILVGTRADRLALGERPGATRTLNIRECDSRELSDTADLVFAAAGRSESLGLSFAIARRGGTVILEGIAGEPPVPVDADIFALKHLTVRGIFGASSGAWHHSVALFSAGLLDLRAMLSHSFRLEEYERAFGLLRDRAAGALKVQLLPNDGETA